MKKLLAITLLSISVWSCAKKMTPAAGSGNAATENTSPVTSPAVNDGQKNAGTGTTASTPKKTYEASDIPKIDAAATDPAVMGKNTYNAKCGRCHAYKVVQDYTADRWISIMQVMAMKANLTETEKANVLVYVKTNAKQG